MSEMREDRGFNTTPQLLVVVYSGLIATSGRIKILESELQREKDKVSTLDTNLTVEKAKYFFEMAKLKKKNEELEFEFAASNEQIADIYVKAQNDILAELTMHCPGDDFS
ncbi:hypothetical protein GH714_010381 [Hevea brasiliensis]|uniref:Uncharacterized protein n=1 Tax=Hevea brasiliensis TaxID=3981 RepID=A0A6A6KP81_HEVBR|nr:hypothetical protein GH714_010381 [Hevea brasiliensis]